MIKKLFIFFIVERITFSDIALPYRNVSRSLAEGRKSGLNPLSEEDFSAALRYSPFAEGARGCVFFKDYNGLRNQFGSDFCYTFKIVCNLITRFRTPDLKLNSMIDEHTSVRLRIKRRFDELLNYTHPLSSPSGEGDERGCVFINYRV
jgi:hypothetical protein